MEGLQWIWKWKGQGHSEDRIWKGKTASPIALVHCSTPESENYTNIRSVHTSVMSFLRDIMIFQKWPQMYDGTPYNVTHVYAYLYVRIFMWAQCLIWIEMELISSERGNQMRIRKITRSDTSTWHFTTSKEIHVTHGTKDKKPCYEWGNWASQQTMSKGVLKSSIEKIGAQQPRDSNVGNHNGHLIRKGWTF